jgi:hypothetical protein
VRKLPPVFVSGINISNLQGVKRVELIDLSGKIIRSKTVNNQLSTRIEAPELAAGIYHLRLVKANGEYALVKLVKL